MRELYIPYRQFDGNLQPTGITRDLSSVRELLQSGEADGYLIGYKVERDDVLDSSLYDLPWLGVDPTPFHIANTLSRALGYRNLHRRSGSSRSLDKRRKYGPKVREVWNLFAELAAAGKPLNIGYYGEKSHMAVYEAFRRVGLDLPEVELPHKY